jgi:tetratricopeptide (TPR) repeat protein
MNLQKIIISLCLIYCLFNQTGCKTTSSDLTPNQKSHAFWLNSNSGVYHLKNHDYNKAISSFTWAIKNDTENPTGYINRGKTFLMIGEFQNAISDFDRAIELTSTIKLNKEIKRDSASAFNGRGIAYSFKGEYEKAILDYTRAIEIAPSDSQYINRAIAYSRKGEYVKSIIDYYKALEINEKNPDALNELSWILATCQDEKYRDGLKAITFIQKALKINSKEYSYLDTQAAAYATTGNFTEALETQEKAISLLKGSTEKNYKTIILYEERLNSYKVGVPWKDNFLRDKDAEENIIDIVTPRYE